jgi:hypothetical protein
MNDDIYPNELLRQKLLVAGIPESEHGVASLLAKIPDFDSQAVEGISADAMAQLFLYLLNKGIISLPVASDKALLDLPWGSHVCQFYDDKSDLTNMLVPYFKQGLDRNEACVWLVGDLTVDEARGALAAAVPDLDHYMRKGQMQVRHYTELYTDPCGGVKPSDQLSHDFAAMGSKVVDDGFSGLRASGCVSWVDDGPSMVRFMDYETKVNLAIENSRMMAVCTYPAHAASICQCRELIHNHGRIFVQRGQWVHDKSRGAREIESVFAALAAQSLASAGVMVG